MKPQVLLTHRCRISDSIISSGVFSLDWDSRLNYESVRRFFGVSRYSVFSNDQLLHQIVERDHDGKTSVSFDASKVYSLYELGGLDQAREYQTLFHASKVYMAYDAQNGDYTLGIGSYVVVSPNLLISVAHGRTHLTIGQEYQVVLEDGTFHGLSSNAISCRVASMNVQQDLLLLFSFAKLKPVAISPVLSLTEYLLLGYSGIEDPLGRSSLAGKVGVVQSVVVDLNGHARGSGGGIEGDSGGGMFDFRSGHLIGIHTAVDSTDSLKGAGVYRATRSWFIPSKLILETITSYLAQPSVSSFAPFVPCLETAMPWAPPIQPSSHIRATSSIAYPEMKLQRHHDVIRQFSQRMKWSCFNQSGESSCGPATKKLRGPVCAVNKISVPEKIVITNEEEPPSKRLALVFTTHHS